VRKAILLDLTLLSLILVQLARLAFMPGTWPVWLAVAAAVCGARSLRPASGEPPRW
jgi:hypothetical protein